MPSFLHRERAKREEPSESRRTIGAGIGSLFRRVLSKLGTISEAPTTARETAAQMAMPKRGELPVRAREGLKGEPSPAQTIAQGLKTVAEEDTTITGRMARTAAQLIEEGKGLAKAVDDAVRGKTRPPHRVDMEAELRKRQERHREAYRELASKLIAGDITPTQFRKEMGRKVRSLLTQAAALGAGGPGNLTGTQAKLLERSIRDQMAYLDGFLRDIRRDVNAGKPLTQRVVGRAGQYAAAASVVADQARRQSMADEVVEDGADLWEVRILGVAEHCEDCVRVANKPAPAGTLPPIGDSRCGQFCKCHFEFGSQAELESKYGRGGA